MDIFTIGFTKKSARQFFELLKRPGLERVLDIRLKNSSQLAGFAKKDDLKFFLREICGIDYMHLPELAPTKQILDDFKKGGGDWAAYEAAFLELLAGRGVEKTLDPRLIGGGCFLCSEPAADKCHRRLAAEYLQSKWPDVHIIHL